jgi:copper resistance protein D
MPVFAPDGGPALVLSRGLAVAFLLSVAGTLWFRVFIVPYAFGRMTPDEIGVVERDLRRWLRASVAGAALGLLAWLVAITASLATPTTLGEWPGDLQAVLTDTSFGHVLIAQLALLAGTVVPPGRNPGALRWWAAFAFGSAASLAEVGHGHAYAMATTDVSFLEMTEVLHLWSAGVWLGGLVPLLLVVQRVSPGAAALTARWFSPVGKVCVILLAATANVQGVVLISSFDALFHTAYGWTALLKLSLYAVLLGFALINRYKLAPELRGSNPSLAHRRLTASLILQTCFGLFVVLAAALLSQLRPGMDMGM